MTTNLSEAELAAVGFASLGEDVRIDRRAAIFVPNTIHLGSHVRIDAFTVIAGGRQRLQVGSFVHIGASCYLSAGDGGIEVGDFVTLAPRVAVHASSDDYVGGHLTGGIVPHNLVDTFDGLIRFGRFVIIGSGTVILPGCDLGEGCAVGALSLVNRSVPSAAVVAGTPARIVGTREQGNFEALVRSAWEQRGP